MTPSPARLVARIDLGRLVANWRALNEMSADAECAAVVKADAYGHGMDAVAPALHGAGCRFFLTASAAEALALRAVLPDAAIGFFEGPSPGDREAALAGRVMPSVNSMADLMELGSWAKAAGKPVPAMLQLDTGMNRLGVGADEMEAVLRSEAFGAGDWKLVFSHLASADEPGNPGNEAQRSRFAAMLEGLPGIPASLAATGGILLGKGYLHQVTRPGIGLYGLPPAPGLDTPLAPVLSLHARVLQIRGAPAGEAVGYNGTARLARPSRLATIAGGYADGVPRQLSNKGLVHLDGLTAPVVGRVSMDSATVDITDWPEGHAAAGGHVDLIHDGYTADDMAAAAGTISYDILTGLGLRAERHYAGAKETQPDP